MGRPNTCNCDFCVCTCVENSRVLVCFPEIETTTDTCGDCPDPPAMSKCWEFTVSGITNAGCLTCDTRLNGAFTLKWVRSCAFQTDNFLDCAGTGLNAFWSLVSDGVNWTLYPAGFTGSTAVYELPVADFVCNASNELFEVSAPTTDCDDWPESITISPVDCFTVDGGLCVMDCHAEFDDKGHFLDQLTVDTCIWKKTITPCGGSITVDYSDKSIQILDIETIVDPDGCFDPPPPAGCDTLVYRYFSEDPIVQPSGCELCNEFAYSGVYIPAPTDPALSCESWAYPMPATLEVCPLECLGDILVIGIIDESQPVYYRTGNSAYNADTTFWNNTIASCNTATNVQGGLFQSETGPIADWFRLRPSAGNGATRVGNNIAYAKRESDANYFCQGGGIGRYTAQDIVDFATQIINDNPGFDPQAVVFSKDISGSMSLGDHCALEEAGNIIGADFDCTVALEDNAISDERWVRNMALTLTGGDFLCTPELYTECLICVETPNCWEVTIGGVTSGTCLDCVDINDVWTLEQDDCWVGGLSTDPECRWGVQTSNDETTRSEACSTFPSTECSETTFDGWIKLYYVETTALWELAIGMEGSETNGAVYELIDANWECLGPNTMNLVSNGGSCATWPATLTLESADA